MKIKISDIPPSGRKISGEEPSSMLEIGDGDKRPTGNGRYDLLVTVLQGQVIAMGSLVVDMEYRCSRCADVFRQAASDSDVILTKDFEKGEESVDLTQELREVTMLSFPSYPLCSQNCRGLCGQCGANLNKGACRCRPGGDMRWGSLDGLKIK